MITIVGVHFRTAGKVYYFDPGDLELKRGTHVIVETARGIEYGMVIMGPKEVEDDKVTQPLKKIIRVATEDDESREMYNRVKEREAYTICKEKIKEHHLEMKLIKSEYTFDNNKLLFYFTADGRVDFRSLVKDLASVFRTRIELRQIGVRDETKLLGGVGICGRELCCHTFLSEFAPVSIKMAKEQNLSLNPSKISGVCGRLMCCLNNEAETYAYLNSKLPRNGETVITPDGIHGTVQSTYILRQTVKVLVEDGEMREIREYPVSELTFKQRKKYSEDKKNSRNKKKKRQDDRDGRKGKTKNRNAENGKDSSEKESRSSGRPAKPDQKEDRKKERSEKQTRRQETHVQHRETPDVSVGLSEKETAGETIADPSRVIDAMSFTVTETKVEYKVQSPQEGQSAFQKMQKEKPDQTGEAERAQNDRTEDVMAAEEVPQPWGTVQEKEENWVQQTPDQLQKMEQEEEKEKKIQETSEHQEEDIIRISESSALIVTDRLLPDTVSENRTKEKKQEYLPASTDTGEVRKKHEEYADFSDHSGERKKEHTAYKNSRKPKNRTPEGNRETGHGSHGRSRNEGEDFRPRKKNSSAGHKNYHTEGYKKNSSHNNRGKRHSDSGYSSRNDRKGSERQHTVTWLKNPDEERKNTSGKREYDSRRPYPDIRQKRKNDYHSRKYDGSGNSHAYERDRRKSSGYHKKSKVPHDD